MSKDGNRRVTLNAVNSALRDLGGRFAAGEISRSEYRRLRRQLVAEVTGDAPGDDDEPTGRHAALGEPNGARTWMWLIPLALALIGLGGLAALIWLLAH